MIAGKQNIHESQKAEKGTIAQFQSAVWQIPEWGKNKVKLLCIL